MQLCQGCATNFGWKNKTMCKLEWGHNLFQADWVTCWSRDFSLRPHWLFPSLQWAKCAWRPALIQRWGRARRYQTLSQYTHRQGEDNSWKDICCQNGCHIAGLVRCSLIPSPHTTAMQYDNDYGMRTGNEARYDVSFGNAYPSTRLCMVHWRIVRKTISAPFWAPH